MKEITLEATDENLATVNAFFEELMEEHDVSMKIMMQINVAVEEIFVNVAHYAYLPNSGPVTIKVDFLSDPVALVATFIDQGKPYNPLLKDDPDVTLSAQERSIGGLGIYIVKKTMDDVKYEYKNNSNILTFQKNLK